MADGLLSFFNTPRLRHSGTPASTISKICDSRRITFLLIKFRKIFKRAIERINAPGALWFAPVADDQNRCARRLPFE
jgi:hypothetical protein